MRPFFPQLVIWLIASLLPVTAQADQLILDPGHTYPHFSVSHLGFSLMYGRFNKTEGVIETNAGEPVSLEVTIDAASIDTGHDIRDSHLRDTDFFNVEEHPTLIYRSTDIQRDSETTATVNGELTLLGVTRPLTLQVENIHCGKHPMTQKYTCGFTASGQLRRSDFGMDAHLPAVGDEVQIRIDAEAGRPVDSAGPRK